MESKNGHSRVAVIGSGPCGMAALAAFSDAERNGFKVPEIVCFEKQKQISGMWNYTWKVGIDEVGENVHSSMYRHMWSNIPKECLEMANYTFDEHFQKRIPSYLPREVVRDYLLGRAKKYNIERYIKLSTVVRNVEKNGEKFLIMYEDLIKKKRTYENFDYVIVAAGHYSFPLFPDYSDLFKFSGTIMHAHDYRSVEVFKNKTIVLIGSSSCAEDIALQSCKYGVKQCIVSCRTESMRLNWPDCVTEVPELIGINCNHVNFADGSSYIVDAIIFCTGYQHHFPFMADDLRLHAKNISYPENLYKGVIFQGNDKIIYLGMQNQYYTFTMFDAEAWYARDYILGKIKLPSKKEQTEDIKAWYERGRKSATFLEEIDFQRDFVKDLLEVSKTKLT